MLFHLPLEKSPLTSSVTCCTSCGKGDDGNVPLILSSVSKFVYVCVCVCVCVGVCIPVKCWNLSLVILDKVYFICGYLAKSALSNCP